MFDFLVDHQIKTIFQLLLSVALGGIVGAEREYSRKEAGLRTYILVCVGSALFTIISGTAFSQYIGREGVSFDPSRIVGQVVVGIGFLGAGIIVFHKTHIKGLTTAAGLWVVAAIGVAIGAELYLTAVFATFLVFGVLLFLRGIEERFLKTKT